MFSYTLALRAESDLDGITSALVSILGIQDPSELPERYPGLFVDATETFIPAQEIVYKRFLGTPATARLHYSMNYGDWERLRIPVAASAARLVVETDALAFMTFSVDSLIMRRTDGVLYLYENSDNTWREPEVISKIPQPWVMTTDEYEGTPPGGSPYG
ncbi:MAG: SitI3 family protein [Micrococcales bacterium]|nr:SitI3 family protein [Micrococcales bacterium]